MISRILSGMLVALCVALPPAAQAQDLPSFAIPGAPADENIHGRIVSFDGGYALSVRDERGYVDHIRLHAGTIINPTGLTLEPGMVVSVLGYNAGNNFAANEVDTPYQFARGFAYYGGRPWNYYGPGVSLDFFFGNGGGGRVDDDVRASENARRGEHDDQREHSEFREHREFHQR